MIVKEAKYITKCSQLNQQPMKKDASKSISGVLYSIIIYLGCQLPDTSSDLTRERGGQPHYSSIRSCSRWGLPSQTVACLLVSSYLAVPSLPGVPGGLFLWYYPWGRPHWTLSSTLPCGAPTFLRYCYPRLSDLLAATIIHELCIPNQMLCYVNNEIISNL